MSKFGNLFLRLEEKKVELSEVQQRVPVPNAPDEVATEEKVLMQEINDILKNQHLLMRQKSRSNWLFDGDRNTSFIHRALRVSKGRISISSLMINGELCEEKMVIVDHILDFYKNLFMDDRSSTVSLIYVGELLEQVVTQEQNFALTNCPSEMEIKQATFDLSADSAPGPDGFGGKFYQQA